MGISVFEESKKAEAVAIIKARYIEFNEYPGDALPPKSIIIEQADNKMYVAFVQNGSGLPFLGARCFIVDAEGGIQETGQFKPSPTTTSGLSFSAKKCRSE